MHAFTSLDAATATGGGVAYDTQGRDARNHSLVVTITGGASVGMSLEGSHDGTNWVQLATCSGSSSPNAAWSGDRVVRYVRANLTSMTGGASPTVTATVMSA